MSGAALVSQGGGRFALTGELVFANARSVQLQGESSFAGLQSVEVDLTGLDRADSAGLAVLLEWAISAREAGRVLRYGALPPVLASMARIGGVEALLREPVAS